MTEGAAIYRGAVVHDRVRPKRHRLEYQVFTILFDIDTVAAMAERSRLLRYNKPGIVSFYDADHGPADGSPLRPWVESLIREAGIEPDGGAIRLLCYPRLFGFVFNPISVYFCYRRTGELAAILYEVCNTYRERHTYVIPVAADSGPVIRQTCSKSLYVSPFIGMDAQYHFRILPPGDTVNIAIRQDDAHGFLLAAAFSGRRRAFDDRSLVQELARFPLMTLKVVAGIHWEALKMWLKGFPVFSHNPAPPVAHSAIKGPSGAGLSVNQATARVSE